MNNWIPGHIDPQFVLNELLDFIPEPIMIVNANGQLLHSNFHFQNMVQKSGEELIGRYYGEAIGCRYFNENPEQCGETYYCEICEIRNAFLAKQNDDDKAFLHDGQIVVREIVTNNTLLTKVFRINIKAIDSKEGKLLICLFNTLSQEDLEGEIE